MDNFYFLDMQQAYYSYLVAMIDSNSSVGSVWIDNL